MRHREVIDLRGVEGFGNLLLVSSTVITTAHKEILAEVNQTARTRTAPMSALE
jgi:hypothetical protein